MTPQDRENLIRYAWGRQYIPTLASVDGHEVSVVSSGSMAEEAHEVDYTDACIMVGQVCYTGAIKIFYRTSQWNQWIKNRKTFYHVVLLLVCEHDEPMELPSGQSAPLMGIPELSVTLVEGYRTLVTSGISLCGNIFRNFNKVEQYGHLTRLMIGRIERKYDYIRKIFDSRNKSWRDTFLFLLFDTVQIASKENRQQFGLLVSRIYYNDLIHKMASQQQVEALLFGTAGLLDIVTTPDTYTYQLRELFDPIKRNYRIEPLNVNRWSFGSRGIGGSLWVTIAQLSALLFRHKEMMLSVVETKTLSGMRALFACSTSEYWLTHPYLGAPKQEVIIERRISDTKIDIFIINLVLPFLFFYHKTKETEEDICDFIILSMEKIKGESNRYTHLWSSFVPIRNSMESQAFIELSKNYCDHKKCHLCSIGASFLKNIE